MPVLGYWSLRGFAQYIRLLLAHVEEEFEDKLYELASPEEWTKDKESLPLDFPNLPYYIDDKVKISQSMAIMQYLGRKYNLNAAADPASQAQQDMLVQEALDLRSQFSTLAYGEDFDKKKPIYLETGCLPRLQRLERFLGDKPWFLGEKLTFVDFIFYELFWHHRFMESTVLDATPKLSAFIKRFEALPKIKKYLETSDTANLPITGPKGRFGKRCK